MKRRKQNKRVWQMPPDAGLGCVGYRVRRLSRVVSGIYDDAFGPLKLKISQFGILAMLSRRGPSSAADLCRLVTMDKSTASRNLQRMRRRGWISIVPETAGSGHRVTLTGEGALVLRNAYPLWQRAQQEATRRLGADGLKALNTVVARINR